jgi:hypothetical protein
VGEITCTTCFCFISRYASYSHILSSYLDLVQILSKYCIHFAVQMYKFLWKGLSVQGFVSIKMLHQDEIRGKVYDARLSTIHFCRSCTVRSIKWWESWFATGYHALSSKRDILKEVRKCGVLLAAFSYYFENYMQDVLLVGNPIQAILHMLIGSPFVGYGTWNAEHMSNYWRF